MLWVELKNIKIQIYAQKLCISKPIWGFWDRFSIFRRLQCQNLCNLPRVSGIGFVYFVDFSVKTYVTYLGFLG